MIAEEEFEIKEEEPWYDLQDLEHDLHLAAELGKNLLEKNNELEQSLKEMYVTNHEQLQEIEYLSKQMDLLRSINDQHVKLYEQLDMTAGDLEMCNQRLVLDNRLAQLKIEGLTETIVGLQCQVEEVQRELVEQKKAPRKHTTQNMPKPPQPTSSLDLPYWNEQCPTYESSVSPSTSSLDEEERAALLHTTRLLQAQLDKERALREAAEQSSVTLARKLSELEPRMALLEGCRARLAELEAEVEESDQPRCSSAEHCAGEKCHGVSLLSEVDAQYIALQKKYNELLRCNRGGPQSHKAVQTQITNQQVSPASADHKCSQVDCTHDSAQMPEYKVLFLEIFACIEKSKEDLKENRAKSN
ncbi:cerebellar degeneration-related protein 2 [Brachyhypopomus gauderio]|uniref:cerebellar degeneration-related protein 2 n=1 Tax=Brachyhypopomus gauderio TaxID=698409 RepID=UPI0040414E0E